MNPARTTIGREPGPRRSRNRMQRPPEKHSLELTGKEPRS
jgi:hypothetical protein